MKFTPTPISGAFLVSIEPRPDERGFFARTYCKKEFEAHGIDVQFVEGNTSMCKSRGTVRGLHWQIEPHAGAKLFRCTNGEIFIAIVDMRPDSPTFKQPFTTRLSQADRNMIFVPTGCASGYQSLTDGAEASYFVSVSYHPESEKGLRWNDPLFNIPWPITEGVILSPKDASCPDYTG